MLTVFILLLILGTIWNYKRKHDYQLVVMAIVFLSFLILADVYAAHICFTNLKEPAGSLGISNAEFVFDFGLTRKILHLMK